MIVVRDADDTIVGFEHQDDAESGLILTPAALSAQSSALP
jgi:hypothetical protein